MAKKSKTRGNKAPSGRQQRQEAKQTQVRQRQRIILGGVILVLVIGIGVFIRYNQQRTASLWFTARRCVLLCYEA